MISRLTGILLQKSSTEVVIDCGGVGYLAFVSVNTSDSMPEAGEKLSVYTLLISREDALQLYGFYNETEREAFRMLTSVSGVGPKIALSVLSSFTVGELQEYIIGGNLHALLKMPGVGKKTAERIMLELRDKIAKLGTTDKPLAFAGANLLRQEALAALATLGYSPAVAEKAVKRAMTEDSGAEITAEQLIKKALRYAMM
jgi:Holliday junction DNA helicase RuvA